MFHRFSGSGDEDVVATVRLSHVSDALIQIGRTSSEPPARAGRPDWLRVRLATPASYHRVRNLVGRTAGEGPALVLGSHLDTVPNAGRYDGPLGILVGLAVVERLSAGGARPAVPLEVSWKPTYWPARTATVSPACTTSAACWRVLQGAESVPAPESSPSGATTKVLGTVRDSSRSGPRGGRLVLVFMPGVHPERMEE